MENLNTIKQKVENLLIKLPETRNSDRLLQFYYWTTYQGIGDMESWLRYAENPENIRRCRQKIQEERPDLRAIEPIKEARFQKQLEFLEFTN